MTHEQVVSGEIIERYVRHALPPADRQAFQEHYFQCDECFEQVQVMARFVAGVRDASASGVLGADKPQFSPNWLASWARPALAASVLLVSVLVGVWAATVWRENQRLTEQAAEQRRASEDVRALEARIRGLESSGAASEQEKASLRQEIGRLEAQLATAERQLAARTGDPAVDVPAINIYPVGDALRSAGAGQTNRVKLPARAATFVLLLSDFQTGALNYRVEVTDSTGRVVTRRAGLKPDRNGEISLSLSRSAFTRGKYAVRLFAEGKAIAEYPVEIE